MSQRISRRDMIKSSALAGAGFWVGTQAARAVPRSANEKLDIACIGVGGRGWANVRGVRSENIVALCDVDGKRAKNAFESYSDVPRFKDYRVLLDKMDRQIDAVVVSTPDHTHFHPSIRALEAGKHLYCEKPMAHSVWEVRQMTDEARKRGLATQLGVQRHVKSNIHRVVEIIRSGAIGDVTEVHSWVSSSRGMPGLTEDRPEVPDHLDWNLWLGPAGERPYDPRIAPYGWRFWWDFGTGETGNWGCHILDIPFWALELDYPTRVEASGPEVHEEMTPKRMASRLDFPARGSRGPVALHWYQAPGGPSILKEKGLPNKGNNLFIGTEGMLLCGFDNRHLYPEKKFADFKEPERWVPDSPGFHREWIAACKGDATAPTCNFDYSGPMTETVLLANVAYRSGEAFEWDSKNLKARGSEKAQALIRETYRDGWGIA